MPISAIIPRPYRDFICFPIELDNSTRAIRREKNWDTKKEDYQHLEPKVEAFVATCLRASLAAIATLAIISTGASIPVAATLGALSSVPCVVLVGGAWLLNHGFTATITALATGSFITLAEALLAIGLGYKILEVHDDSRWSGLGLVDHHVIVPISEALKMVFLNQFM